MSETGLLSRERTQHLLEEMRKRISNSGMGVTLVEDHNGAWGQIGSQYLTVRFNDPNMEWDMINISMTITKVSSLSADLAEEAYRNENK